MSVPFLVLLACQLAGEIIQQAFALPMPGPVIGMLLLTIVLMRRPAAVPEPLSAGARVLLRNLGLFFVPAGVGVVANLHLIRQQWMPICAALLGSTSLSLLATAIVVRLMQRRAGRARDFALEGEGRNQVSGGER